jgi:hypothetical protein
LEKVGRMPLFRTLDALRREMLGFVAGILQWWLM